MRIYGYPSERVDVAPHGVDGDRFQAHIDPASIAATLRRLRIEAPYVLFLGTLQPRKNLGTLARAYSVARAAGPFTHARGWRVLPAGATRMSRRNSRAPEQ